MTKFKEKFSFLQFYYEVVVFELTVEYGGGSIVPLRLIADAFLHASSVFYRHAEVMTCPCRKYIKSAGIDDDGIGIREFLCRIHPPQLLPGELVFEETPWRFTGILSQYDYKGYTMSTDAIVLPTLTSADKNQFVINYMELVPAAFKDDISVLICQLLKDFEIPGFLGDQFAQVYENQLRGIAYYTQSYTVENRDLVKSLVTLPRIVDHQKNEQQQQQQQQEQEGQDQEQHQQKVIPQMDQEERAKIWTKEQGVRDAKIKANWRVLDAAIDSFADQAMATAEERQQKVSGLWSRINNHLQLAFGDKIKVVMYGSYASGLSDNDSDADFTVLGRAAKVLSLQNVSSVLRRQGFKISLELRNARVPIVTFVDPMTHFKCDMTLQQPMAVQHAKLLDAYRRIDNRFMPLWFALRRVAKHHGILRSNHGYLSSYALALMLVSFLQNTEPPIFPSLQHLGGQDTINGAKPPAKAIVEGWDCTFALPSHYGRNSGDKNETRRAQLLIDLCWYYGFCHSLEMEINVRVGAVQVRDVSYAEDKVQEQKLLDAPVSIMDPFSRAWNVAANVSRVRWNEILQVFQTVHGALEDGDVDAAFGQ